jgi:hypothetical protein
MPFSVTKLMVNFNLVLNLGESLYKKKFSSKKESSLVEQERQMKSPILLNLSNTSKLSISCSLDSFNRTQSDFYGLNVIKRSLSLTDLKIT